MFCTIVVKFDRFIDGTIFFRSSSTLSVGVEIPLKLVELFNKGLGIGEHDGGISFDA